MASSCRWAVRVSSAGGSSKTSESRQPPDTTGVEGLRTTAFFGLLLIRMRSGWIPTRNVARISVRNCTHISTTNGTPSRYKGALDGPAFMLPGYTVREIFDAFIYGAALLHKIPDIGDPKRKRFLDNYDK